MSSKYETPSRRYFVTRCTISECNFTSINLAASEWTECEISETAFSACVASQSAFHTCTFDSVRFFSTSLDKSSFERSSWKNVVVASDNDGRGRRSSLSQTVMPHALTSCRFVDVNMATTVWSRVRTVEGVLELVHCGHVPQLSFRNVRIVPTLIEEAKDVLAPIMRLIVVGSYVEAVDTLLYQLNHLRPGCLVTMAVLGALLCYVHNSNPSGSAHMTHMGIARTLARAHPTAREGIVRILDEMRSQPEFGAAAIPALVWVFEHVQQDAQLAESVAALCQSARPQEQTLMFFLGCLYRAQILQPFNDSSRGLAQVVDAVPSAAFLRVVILRRSTQLNVTAKDECQDLLRHGAAKGCLYCTLELCRIPGEEIPEGTLHRWAERGHTLALFMQGLLTLQRWASRRTADPSKLGDPPVHLIQRAAEDGLVPANEMIAKVAGCEEIGGDRQQLLRADVENMLTSKELWDAMLEQFLPRSVVLSMRAM
jgi:hypothetical protein